MTYLQIVRTFGIFGSNSFIAQKAVLLENTNNQNIYDNDVNIRTRAAIAYRQIKGGVQLDVVASKFENKKAREHGTVDSTTA